ncbi:MAG: DUF460 domain-containing protein [Thermoproteota archaeon]
MQASKHPPKTIVGLDPGTTTGLAILNLNGEVILLKSLRHWSRSEIILEILNNGNPVLIATDRFEAPRAVKELAQALSLTLFTPEKEDTLENKSTIISEFTSKTGVKVEDEHQASALYAALKAFNSFKNDFKDIELSVERRIGDFKSILIEEVKSDLIRGIPPERSIRERLTPTPVQSVDTTLVEQLRKQLLEERRKVEVLTLKLENLRSELRKTESRKPAEKEGEPQSIISYTPAGSRLTSLNGLLKERETGLGEHIQVDVFTELTSKKAKNEVKNSVVAAKNLKGDPSKIFRTLSSKDVKIMILDVDAVEEELTEEAARQGILLCEMKNVPLEKKGEELYVRRSDVKNLLNKRRSLLTTALLDRLKEFSSR